MAEGVNGDYTLLYTDGNGCDKFSEVTNIITIDDIGFNENNAFEVKLYPNPTNGVFDIELDVISKYDVIVYNVVGQIVFSGFINTMSKTINLSNLEKGVYTVDLVDENVIYTEKVIIK